MTRTVYGIASCDTCRAARRDLEAAGVSFEFHDVRDDPPDASTWREWIDALGANRVINKQSTTWRHLKPNLPVDLDDAAAVDVLRTNPTLLKRPLFDRDGELALGYAPADRQQRLDWFAA